MSWYSKVGNFLKEAWAPVFIILSAVFGFIIGRQSVRRTIDAGDPVREHIGNIARELEEERRTIQLLRDKLSESESAISKLEGNNTERIRIIEDQRRRIDRLETDISDAERIIDLARTYHADTGSGVEGVDKLTERLRATIDRHRTELEKIKVNKPAVDRSGSI